MATRHVRDKDLGMKRIMAELHRADDMVVDVGLFAGGAAPDGVTVAEYGAYNEFGTSRIPSRPFMAISFDENIGQINRDIQRGFRNVSSGRSADAELNIIGLKHQQRIQRTIKGRDILPKLADSTIAAKGSTKTLVDTGQMVNAVTYEVGRK